MEGSNGFLLRQTADVAVSGHRGRNRMPAPRHWAGSGLFLETAVGRLARRARNRGRHRAGPFLEPTSPRLRAASSDCRRARRAYSALIEAIREPSEPSRTPPTSMVWVTIISVTVSSVSAAGSQISSMQVITDIDGRRHNRTERGDKGRHLGALDWIGSSPLAGYSPLAGRGRRETEVVYKGRMAEGEPKTETALSLVPLAARPLAWSMG